MIKVGLTGGIGSGKSTLSKIFRVLGIPVYIADDRAKYLMNTLPELKNQIRKHFGDQSYVDERLNRAYLAGLVFNHSDKLEELNALVHPEVVRDFRNWLLQFEGIPYIVHEAAILFESGVYRMMDYSVCVYAKKELRIQRVVNRDGSSKEMVLQRMARQYTDEQRNSMADFVIDNNENDILIPQILNLHNKFVSLQT
jgi:dephospho-CoA kinase